MASAGDDVKEEPPTSVTTLGDGGKRYEYADGSWLETGPDGVSTRKQYTASTQTLVELLPNGTRQTRGDTVLTALNNGFKTQVRGTLTISHMPGGIVVQEETGGEKPYKATRFPDGFELVELPNGTSIDRAPDGSVRTTFPDGHVVTAYPDGSKQIEDADGGNVRHVPAPERAEEWGRA